MRTTAERCINDLKNTSISLTPAEIGDYKNIVINYNNGQRYETKSGIEYSVIK